MPEKSNRDLYLRAISDGMAELLIPLGFKKKRVGLFVRTLDEVTHIIQTQSSTSSTRDRLRLTVNFGLTPEAATLTLHAPYPPASEVYCMARRRIKLFEGDRDDHWWVASSAREAVAAKDAINRALEDYVLPLLATLSDGKSVLESWTGQTPNPMWFSDKYFVELLRAGLEGREPLSWDKV